LKKFALIIDQTFDVVDSDFSKWEEQS